MIISLHPPWGRTLIIHIYIIEMVSLNSHTSTTACSPQVVQKVIIKYYSTPSYTDNNYPLLQ